MFLRNKVHDEVDSQVLLVDVLHAYHEGMVHLEKNNLLQMEALNWIMIHHYILPDTFHCIKFSVLFVLH